jgi:hypothetical protein
LVHKAAATAAAAAGITIETAPILREKEKGKKKKQITEYGIQNVSVRRYFIHPVNTFENSS